MAEEYRDFLTRRLQHALPTFQARPPQKFKDLVAEGRIHSRMKREDAEQLSAKRVPRGADTPNLKRVTKVEPKTTAEAEEEYCHEGQTRSKRNDKRGNPTAWGRKIQWQATSDDFRCRGAWARGAEAS